MYTPNHSFTEGLNNKLNSEVLVDGAADPLLRPSWLKRTDRMIESLRTIPDRFLSWTDRCPLCFAPTASHGFCEGCWQDMPFVEHSCHRCAAPLTNAHDTVCGQCLQTPMPFVHCVSALHYRFPIAALITQFKYQEHSELAKKLAQPLIHALKHHYTPLTIPRLIIPMPLHAKRLKERGYNQSERLAKYVAKAIDAEVASDLCKRVRRTATQSKLSQSDRRSNLRDAFEYCGPPPCERYRKQPIAILDDVMSTGATAFSLCGTLREAGFQNVHMWSIARAALD